MNAVVIKLSEADIHKQVARWLDVALTPASWWTTIPLGGGGVIRGAHLKRSGAKKGSPDILIIHDGRALFIELKAAKGRVSDEQGECHQAIWSAGAVVVICRSVDDVRRALLAFGAPVRVTA